METTGKKIHYVGFWTQELKDLLEHLEVTGYKETEVVTKFRDILKASEEKESVPN